MRCGSILISFAKARGSFHSRRGEAASLNRRPVFVCLAIGITMVSSMVIPGALARADVSTIGDHVMVRAISRRVEGTFTSPAGWSLVEICIL